ncbi:MAG: MarR family winged helix-turn-helix transcriptional regulator [Beutenbergiaceae bacterium]
MVETNTLTEDEKRTWLALTGMLARLPAALDAQMNQAAGLTFFEFTVLSMLAEAPDQTLRMSALAERTNGSLSRLSHVVSRLEAQGLVRRENAPEDRRATNAVLTDDGAHRVKIATPAHVQYARALILQVADQEDLETFGRVGSQILDQLISR